MSSTHKIFMNYYSYEVMTDRMTGRKYYITEDRQIIYIEEDE